MSANLIFFVRQFSIEIIIFPFSLEDRDKGEESGCCASLPTQDCLFTQDNLWILELNAPSLGNNCLVVTTAFVC